MEVLHMGPWEEDIGFSQAIRIGNRVLISGVTADLSKAVSVKDQVSNIYESLRGILSHFGCGFNNVIKETIFTTDIDELKKHQGLRKSFYTGHGPTATWVEVRRLYSPEHLVEIEIEAIKE